MELPELQKQLLVLLSDGVFHSGSELASKLGVTRSAIWKQLQALSDYGIEYSAVSGKGYKIARGFELLNEFKIKNSMSDSALDLMSNLFIHDVIDSTNSHLNELANSEADSGVVCVTEFQSSGKGRRGRNWVSPFGCNIYLSVLSRFQGGPSNLSGLSLAIGVAVIRALNQLNITNIGLKWPNDIYYQGHKLGGILVEVSGEANGPCVAVVGLGLNLYLSPKQGELIDQAWTDLQTILGKNEISRNKLIGTLLNQLLPVLADYENTSLSSYIDEWRQYDCLKNQSVQMQTYNQQIDGIAMGIDEQGMLLLQIENHGLKAFSSGEVSLSLLSSR